MKKVYVIWMACVVTALSLQAGNRLARYRVRLTDKAVTEYSLEQPEKYLSPKAVERRQRQGLKVDSTDLPVPRVYLERLAKAGMSIVGTSRWNNTVLVETSDSVRAAALQQLPFVRSVLKVWTAPDSIPQRNASRKNEVNPDNKKLPVYYGAAQNQAEMLNLPSLHQAGFRGQGMTIAIMDGGFLNADVIPLLSKVKIEGVRNFVHPGWDVYAELDHGMSVLSCMAADTPEVMVGTSPEASYWLFCTEDPDCECMAEEDYWAQAIEYADSLGVDIVNTSLGYHAFDDTSKNYRYRDLDGHTSLMSASASMAASKGMLVVCSAGNSGNKVWKKITPPADAENVLTVGAVDASRVNTVFSSVGNTADGRVKPDVMARGGAATVIRPDGSVRQANGTSFSTPVLCGAVACLWQACPRLTVYELIDLVHRVSDRYGFPDNIYGYGIPDIWKAYTLYSQEHSVK